MSVIDQIMQHEAARIINARINDLPKTAKFRAASAIRSLQWANSNYDAGMPIPAAYFALHATEEAVASFICSTKACGYGNDAKINFKDHQAKATVSLLAQIVINLLKPYQFSIAVDPKTNTLHARFYVSGEVRFAKASTDLVHFTDDKVGSPTSHFYNEILAELGDIGKLRQEVIDVQEARNRILYATDSGFPTGFDHPEASLIRECKLTLGLVWAATDVAANSNLKIALIAQVLRTANMVIADLKAKKSGSRVALLPFSGV
jgi:hypothetical protein